MVSRLVNSSLLCTALLIPLRLVVCADTVIGLESFGAEASNDTGSPIGGGTGYLHMVTSYDYTVTNLTELLTALGQAVSGETIYVPEDAEIDMTGQEAVGSMGTDSPLAVLSERPQLLFNYFKQLFAQVTNPPIDPLRESLVMSLMSFIGREQNLLDETAEHARQLKLPHPILSSQDVATLRSVEMDGL